MEYPELSETCRVSCQNKFVKLVHLVGFIIKKLKAPQQHILIHTGIIMYLTAAKHSGGSPATNCTSAIPTSLLRLPPCHGRDSK
jgi:hypothetical protein